MSDDVWRRRNPSEEPDDQELMNVGGRHEEPTNAFPAGSVSGPVPTSLSDELLDSPDVDLGEDPFDDDLNSQLKARTPLKLTSRTTLALSGVVLFG